MSVTDIYLYNIGTRSTRVEAELESDPPIGRLLHVMTQSQGDVAPLLNAVASTLRYLDRHERQNPLGREQWNDDIRAAILAAIKKAS